jgi:hypothetical protein
MINGVLLYTTPGRLLFFYKMFSIANIKNILRQPTHIIFFKIKKFYTVNLMEYYIFLLIMIWASLLLILFWLILSK